MATKSPLVVASGQVQQLQPASDVADIGYPVFGLKSRIINGHFRIAQKGVNTWTAATENLMDRWRVQTNGTLGTRTITRPSSFGSADFPYEIRDNIKLDQTVAGSGQTIHKLEQRILFSDTFAGKVVTLSFYAKADSSRTLSAGMTQNFGTSGSADVNITPQNFNVTSSWQRFSLTFTIPSVSGKTAGTVGTDYLAVFWSMPLNATYTHEMTGVQLERGPVATEFEIVPFSVSRLLCFRTLQVRGEMFGAAHSTTQVALFWDAGPTFVRSIPTVTMSTSTPEIRDAVGNVFTGTASTITYIAGAGSRGGVVMIDGFTGLTANRPYMGVGFSVIFDCEI